MGGYRGRTSTPGAVTSTVTEPFDLLQPRLLHFPAAVYLCASWSLNRRGIATLNTAFNTSSISDRMMLTTSAPHDCFYGLLGIVEHVHHNAIYVDYTVPQLFTQATLNLLQEHGPHILTFVVCVKHATHTKQDLAGFSTGPTPKSELRGCCGELLVGLQERAIAFTDSKTRLKILRVNVFDLITEPILYLRKSYDLRKVTDSIKALMSSKHNTTQVAQALDMRHSAIHTVLYETCSRKSHAAGMDSMLLQRAINSGCQPIEVQCTGCSPPTPSEL